MHLTIGVTGHRDLVAEEIPALKKQVRGFFRQLKTEFPHLELQLITPLAEGSDRLVADIAIEMGIGLIVPLPMPQADYERDFLSPASIESFRGSLQNARVINLRTAPAAEGRPMSEAVRDRQYAQ